MLQCRLTFGYEVNKGSYLWVLSFSLVARLAGSQNTSTWKVTGAGVLSIVRLASA